MTKEEILEIFKDFYKQNPNKSYNWVLQITADKVGISTDKVQSVLIQTGYLEED